MYIIWTRLIVGWSFHCSIYSGLCCLSNDMNLLNRICVISGLRVRAFDNDSDRDITYSLPVTHIWSILEPTLAICTSSLPIARPVFPRAWPYSSTSGPLIGHVSKSKSPKLYGSSEEGTAGSFHRLNEHEMPLKNMMVTAGNECGDDL